ncbi:MAG: transposase [Anaerolineales bacterium]|nr:transposase [Anaerolineales bacterium]
MIAQESLLVILVQLVCLIPLPPPPAKRGRGRPWVYPDQLFLQALVIMMVKRLHKANEFLAVLAEPTPEMICLRAMLTDENGRFPSRRTWERRLATIPAALPAQIACLGRYLATLIEPWAGCARAAAIDSTVLRAAGGVWHKKDREAGVIPHSSIDTEAHWTKSGWHGWVYGWKLHLVCTAAAVWIPLAADLTPANAADNEIAFALVPDLPPDLRFLLGDQHYHDPELEDLCAHNRCWVITPTGGPYPHRDDGVEVRRILHKTRSLAIENFNEQFKGIFEAHQPVPTKGLVATRRFALGAIFLYQLALLYRFQHGLELRVGLKAFIRAA